MKLDQLDTPSLLIDRERLLKNLADMQRYADSYGMQLRPHTKTLKCPPSPSCSCSRAPCGVAAAKDRRGGGPGGKRPAGCLYRQ